MGATRLLAWMQLVMVGELSLRGRSEMLLWDPEACKGLRKRRWRGGLLEPGRDSVEHRSAQGWSLYLSL